MIRVVVVLVFAAAVCALPAGCAPPASADVIVDLAGTTGLQGLVRARAELTLTDENGRHPDVVQRDIDESVTVAGVDVPVTCTDVACTASLTVQPGRYDARLVLSAVDRCGARAPVLAFSGVLDVAPWQFITLDLQPSDASFDADDDGIIDVFEARGCGRFDLDEGNAPPRSCGAGREDCCDAVSPFEGGAQAFTGGTHRLPYDLDGVAGDDVVDVAPFALDATEVTWGMLARCVHAGVCLAGRPEHPARARLAAGVDLRLPVQGLAPSDAVALCGFFGRRLADDAAWDFAAAHVDADTRADYPFDVAVGDDVGCDPDDPPPAARHKAANRACGAGPLPVGSFPTTAVTRGAGTPLVDLAGNVAEWTLIGAPTTLTDDDADGIPDGVRAVALRGGGAESIVELLENDLPILFDDLAADAAALEAVTAIAGFRCMQDVVDGSVAPPTSEEPACPAGEGRSGGAGGSVSEGPVAPDGGQ